MNMYLESKRGKQKNKWFEVMQSDMKFADVREENAKDREN